MSSFLGRNLLGVSTVGHWLVVIIFKPNVSQNGVGNVLHCQPLHLELTFEFVILPDPSSGLKINWTDHFCHSTELPTAVNTEEQIDWPEVSLVLICFIEPLVPVLSAAPDPVQNTFINILLAVAFNDKISSPSSGYINKLIIKTRGHLIRTVPRR